MEGTLHVKDVRYKYLKGAVALDGCDLSVAGRHAVGLLGPNGSGKTTLLSLIARQRVLQKGTIRLDGEPPLSLLRIGWGSSEGLLYDDVKFQDFVEKAFGPGLGVERAAERGRELAGLLDMTHHYAKRPRQFSQGTRVKASILLAFLERPDLVILDEPFNGLDVDTVDRMLRLVKDEMAASPMTVLIADHQVGILDGLVDDVAFIGGGKIHACGSAADFTARHGNLKETYRAVFDLDRAQR